MAYFGMFVYIVYDATSGKFLPKARYSATHVKLTDKGVPRIFTSKAAAKQAMDWWKAGEHYYSHYTNYEGEPGEHLEVREVPERKNIKLTVTRLYMQEI